MSKLKLAQGTWVVVCDGAHALILENVGDERFPTLNTREDHAQTNPTTQAQGTDRPGRTHSSAGSGRSAMEQTDWHDQAEAAFLRELATRLDRAVSGGETKAIVLVAAPRALGMIRPVLSKAVQAAIITEIAKDYVKKPVYEIEKALVGEATAS